MRLLFTCGSTPLSWAIRHITGEDCSHCAIEAGSHVIHADLLGVRAVPRSEFLSNHTVVHALDIPDNWEKLLNTFATYDRTMYDLPALIYLGLKLLLPFLPQQNLWRNSGLMLCTEWVEEYADGTEDATITPYQLYLKLQKELAS